MPALIAALGNADQNVRMNAAVALGQIGPAAEKAAPALMAALGDANGDVRANAAKALRLMAGPVAMPAGNRSRKAARKAVSGKALGFSIASKPVLGDCQELGD